MQEKREKFFYLKISWTRVYYQKEFYNLIFIRILETSDASQNKHNKSHHKLSQ